MKGVKGFLKGQSGNPNGRPKGAENIVTGQIRSLWQDLMTENVDQLKSDFKTLKPKERLDMAIRMTHFLVPKLQSIEIDSYPEWEKLLRLTPEARAIATSPSLYLSSSTGLKTTGRTTSSCETISGIGSLMRGVGR